MSDNIKHWIAHKKRLFQLFPTLYYQPLLRGGSGQELVYDYSDLDKEFKANLFSELYSESDVATHTREIDQPWQSARQVRIHFVWGMRGSGKSSAMEETAELYYKEGLNIWHLWGARSFENLFWCINQNCEKKWEASLPLLTDNEREQLSDRIHCNCKKAYPIMWIVPNYIDFNQESLDRFNGHIWKNMDEYKEHARNGWVSPEINQELKDKINSGKLVKPKELWPSTDLIKIAHVPIPKNAESKFAFKKAFEKAVLEARNERRIVVMNPAIFEGETDKFKVIAEIFSLIPSISSEHFRELDPYKVAAMRGETEPVPKSKWNPKELGWGKIVVVINELRTVAPTNKYLPQKGASDSKRPIVDIIPELRHLRTWFMGDLQNPDDLNSSVRPQANNVIIKNSTLDLLGAEWKGFFTTIEYNRMREFARWGFPDIKDSDDEKKVPQEYRTIVNKKYPSISELPKNKGYVVYRNGEFLLETFNFPTFHHKKENEKFEEITQIEWKINEKKLGHGIGQTTETVEKTKSSTKKETTNKVLKKAIELYVSMDKPDWDEVGPKLKELESVPEDKGGIPSSENSSLSGKALSNKINRDKDLKEILQKSKQNKKPMKNT